MAETTTDVTRKRPQRREALSFHLHANGQSAREKCEIADDVTHVAARGIEGASVQASPKTVVDPVFDEIDLAAARAILRESRVAPHPWHGAGLEAVVEVTAGAPQRVADIARQAVPGGEEDRTPSKGSDPEYAVAQLRVGRDPEPGAWFGSGLDCGGGVRLAASGRVLECSEQQSSCADDYAVRDPGRGQSQAPS